MFVVSRDATSATFAGIGYLQIENRGSVLFFDKVMSQMLTLSLRARGRADFMVHGA